MTNKLPESTADRQQKHVFVAIRGAGMSLRFRIPRIHAAQIVAFIDQLPSKKEA